MYIFYNRLYSEPFSFKFGAPRYYLYFFDSHKIRILLFYMIEHIELVYVQQNRVEKGILYFFWEILFRANLLLTLGCLDNINILFDSLKYRIFVFYMRERMELVYIVQHRVENGIVYFVWQILLRAILFLTLGYLDNI